MSFVDNIIAGQDFAAAPLFMDDMSDDWRAPARHIRQNADGSLTIGTVTLSAQEAIQARNEGINISAINAGQAAAIHDSYVIDTRIIEDGADSDFFGRLVLGLNEHETFGGRQMGGNLYDCVTLDEYTVDKDAKPAEPVEEPEIDEDDITSTYDYLRSLRKVSNVNFEETEPKTSRDSHFRNQIVRERSERKKRSDEVSSPHLQMSA